jgi:hypothetical protein
MDARYAGSDDERCVKRPIIPKEAKVYDILSEYSHTVTEEKYIILDHDNRIIC